MQSVLAEKKKDRNVNYGNEMPILVDNKRGDEQPTKMPLLKPANLTSEAALSTIDSVYEVRVGNGALRASKLEQGARTGPNLRFARNRDEMLTDP